MRRFVFALLMLGLTAGVAGAAPSYIAKDNRGGYNVTYDYTDKQKNDWYVSLRATLSLLNWKNEYSSDYTGTNADFNSDAYSFKPVFGGDIAVGKKFGYHWRGEAEVGYMGLFTDKGAGFDFSFQTPYLMVNAMYDFFNGLYLGGGVGVAVPILTMDGDIFLPGDRQKIGVSPMAGLMLGYARKLDDNLVLDLRYRIAGFNGTTISRKFEDTLNNQYYLDTKVGLVLDNSFSVGLRYEF